MNTTNNEIAPRKSFTRVLDNAGIKSFVKEAKRVGYNVEVWRFDDTGKSGPIYGYEVKDGDALVFKSMKMRPGIWATTFSTLYWKDPLAA